MPVHKSEKHSFLVIKEFLRETRKADFIPLDDKYLLWVLLKGKKLLFVIDIEGSPIYVPNSVQMPL